MYIRRKSQCHETTFKPPHSESFNRLSSFIYNNEGDSRSHSVTGGSIQIEEPEGNAGDVTFGIRYFNSSLRIS